jgi:hypothetical protein
MTKYKRVNLSSQDRLKLRLPGQGEERLDGILNDFRKKFGDTGLFDDDSLEFELRKTWQSLYTDAFTEARDTFVGPLENINDALTRQRNALTRVVEPVGKLIADSSVPHWKR